MWIIKARQTRSIQKGKKWNATRIGDPIKWQTESRGVWNGKPDILNLPALTNKYLDFMKMYWHISKKDSWTDCGENDTDDMWNRLLGGWRSDLPHANSWESQNSPRWGRTNLGGGGGVKVLYLSGQMAERSGILYGLQKTDLKPAVYGVE